MNNSSTQINAVSSHLNPASSHLNFASPPQSLKGLAAYLYQDGLLDFKIAQNALMEAHHQEIAFTDYIIKSKILSGKEILSCCEKNYKLPCFNLDDYQSFQVQNKSPSPAIPPAPLSIAPALLHRYRILPLSRTATYLELGIVDPSIQTEIAFISFQTGLPIHFVLVDGEKLDKILQTIYPLETNSLKLQLQSTLAKLSLNDEESSLQMDAMNDDEPVIHFVNELIKDAINQSASDIHLEPFEQYCRVRLRQDGLLTQLATIPKSLANRIMLRLKIMANLNIAERRLPQDGHIQFFHLTKINIRINTCPTLFGEKIVLRILNTHSKFLDLALLGMTEHQQQLFRNALRKPQGLILVTGATGSGKTITLYSALHYLNCDKKNICTVEDPVEIELSGINQVSVNAKIGLDFASILRTLLRQDPDILMIGEIRDSETALIAIQAAQTGHLVLATLHTNNAIDAFIRLETLGIAPYQLSSTVSLIIAQRLIRTLCSYCNRENALLHEVQSSSTRCSHCTDGYHGRTGMFELISVDDTLKNHLLLNSPPDRIVTHLKNNNHMSLYESGLEKVKSHQTDLFELNRTLGLC